jgi:hypothetical protein
MKRGIMLILSVLFILLLGSIVTAYNFPSNYDCTETDGTKDPYIKGTVFVEGSGYSPVEGYCEKGTLSKQLTDKCSQDNDYVIEYYCSPRPLDLSQGNYEPVYFVPSDVKPPCVVKEDQSLALYYEEIECEHGCQDGACIDSQDNVGNVQGQRPSFNGFDGTEAGALTGRAVKVGDDLKEMESQRRGFFKRVWGWFGLSS